MLVNIDFVRFPANYASDCAVATIYMAWSLTRVTYAGLSCCISVSGTGIHLGIVDKSTPAMPYALHQAYAR